MEEKGYKPLTKEEYNSIKVGDVLERMLGFVIPVYVNVINVTDTVIDCGWTFDRNTGLEIDEFLQDINDRREVKLQISYISKILSEEQKEIVKNGGKL